MVTQGGRQRDLSGIHAVLYALFDKDQQVDRAAMQRQAQLMLAEGVQGVAVLGLATEVQKLTRAEQEAIIRIVAKEVAGRVPYSVTITGNTVKDQRAMAQFAIAEGADCLILQPPAVGSFSGDEYIDFFLRVVDGLDTRCAIQNAPQYLGRALSAQDIVRLRKANARFDVIKAECPAVDLAHLVKTAGAGLCVLNGRGGLEMTDCLKVGAQGFVLAPDAIDHACRVYHHWWNGDEDAALAAHRAALPAIVFVMQSIEHLICYGKRVFGLRAGFEIHDRRPCLQPTKAGLRLTKQWAENLGSFGGAPKAWSQ